MKYLITLLALFMIVGCSSKTVTWNALGKKIITTKSNEDIYHEMQKEAWKGYFEALKNPPVIAEIQNIDGTIFTIRSQTPPPAPVIHQHQNQYIQPIAGVLKWGIGGVVIDRGISAVVRGMGDTVVSNAGDGTVYIDRSDSIAGKSNTEITTGKLTDNSDNRVINPDPTVIVVDPPEPVIVEPVVVDPVIVNPVVVDPVIVDPSYPPVP